MRKEINRETSLAKVAKVAMVNFISTLQKEILPITFGWQDRECEVYTSVGWYDPKQYDEMDGFYGTTAGMYMSSEVGEYFIWLPKTTKAYGLFYTTMAQLCKIDDNLNEDSIPDEIILHFDGNSNVQIKFATYVHNVENDIEMNAAKTMATLMLEMLSEHEICEETEFYEGDDEPEEHIYRPGDAIPSNYFVGVKTKYNFFKVR